MGHFAQKRNTDLGFENTAPLYGSKYTLYRPNFKKKLFYC